MPFIQKIAGQHLLMSGVKLGTQTAPQGTSSRRKRVSEQVPGRVAAAGGVGASPKNSSLRTKKHSRDEARHAPSTVPDSVVSLILSDPPHLGSTLNWSEFEKHQNKNQTDWNFRVEGMRLEGMATTTTIMVNTKWTLFIRYWALH